MKEGKNSSSSHSQMTDKKKVKSAKGIGQADGETVQKMLDIEDQGYQVGDSRIGDSKWTLKQLLKNMIDEIRKKRK